ncbi:hypothetical protein KDA_63050 [Dictyobacter alpinus]|uniref:ChrB N-terminal domain-containing protein n=1 Tax=Dictyobacter alpinus TaxID=2014873 RepID=A0A402BHD4_9CHLR|nr:Chromate resistance protein ChrB [Dictyobacter alpinus]GCE30821.1 hypothetical protein KDA_63050 [Dictyobacter alpinus]
MEQQPKEWLVFITQIPLAANKLRMSLTRRLSSKGALQTQNNLWMLPYTIELENFIVAMITDIEQHGGSASFFISRAGNTSIERKLIKQFQAQVHQEYEIFRQNCQGFLDKIEQDSQAQTWLFTDLEANERALHRLTAWLPKIRSRDFFPSADTEATQTIYAQCSQALYEFAITVYTYNDPTVSASSPDLSNTEA